MPDFHPSIAVLPLPFRSAIPLCRCDIPWPFIRSVATIAVVHENGIAENIFPYL